jgi:hypothetical protein
MSLSVPEAVFYTGIDWAAETHAVCVLDGAGKAVARFTVAHSAEGLGLLIARLARLGDPADMPVAIERPSGALVDALLEAGRGRTGRPNAIKTWREGEGGVPPVRLRRRRVIAGTCGCASAGCGSPRHADEQGTAHCGARP